MTNVYLPPSRKENLSSCRSALEEFVRGGKLQREEVDDPYLRAGTMVFVSLHKQEELRGCIGKCTPKARLV